MQISAILSDYDGTLSPTSFKSDNKTQTITKNSKTELDRVLWEISNKRTIAIVSTKDFSFLHDRTKFASIISCMMSIETIVLKHVESDLCYQNNCVLKSILNIDLDILRKNETKMFSIIKRISMKFKNVSIYRKQTYLGNLLGGITIDWRQLNDWNSIRSNIEQEVSKIIDEINTNLFDSSLFVQRYSSHPFIDIYPAVCSKEIAYNNISKIIHDSNSHTFSSHNILYLGDSENDNPAFRKADVSIGIKSDERLNPKLECQYLINFSQLPKFLMSLLKNDFNFSERLFWRSYY
jgi:hydroxymethylpyrimidine pyrophosphatase-like HAD family hydrolase